MTANKRRKNSRQRGSHTHGWGSKKKHRGAGNRGGSGLAGTGKRASSTRPSYWADTKYFGKYGFVNRGKSGKIAAVNISLIEEKFQSFVERKLITPKEGGFSINLKDLGFNKLLGRGKPARKLFVKCDYASAKAIQAVESAGGKVTLLKKEETGNAAEGHTPKSS